MADRSAEDEVDEDDERPLKLILVSSEKGGKALACSRRMIIEAKWLLKYTAQWNREGMLLYAGIARPLLGTAPAAGISGTQARDLG